MAATDGHTIGAQELAEQLVAKQTSGLRADGIEQAQPAFCSPGTPARSDALLVAQAVHQAMQPQGADEAEDRSALAAAADQMAHQTEHTHVPPCTEDKHALPMESGPPRQLQACAADEDFEEIRTGPLTLRDNPRQRVIETAEGPTLLPRYRDPLAVVAWGCAHNYQLGTGQYMAQDTPVIVSPLLNVGAAIVDVSCGGDHSGAVDSEGRLYMWGLSDHGRLGLPTARDAPMPSVVRSLGGERVVAVTCGMYSTACISEGMRVFTWGAGGSGQLGHGDGQDEWVPRLVEGLQGCRIVQVALGFRHSMALAADGKVYAWGEGASGQLGHGDGATHLRPKQVELSAAGGEEEVGSVVLVGCGANFSALLTSRGRVLTTGSSEYGALGLGRTRRVLEPTAVTSKVLAKRCFVHLGVGEEHCGAVTSKGNVYMWGQGCFGAVGKAAPSRLMHPPDCPRPYRLPLPEGRRAKEVACGGNYTALVLGGGEVMVLGDDDTRLRSLGCGKGDAVLRGRSLRCGRFHTMALCGADSVQGIEHAGGWMDSGPGVWVAQILAPLKAVLDALGGRAAPKRRRRALGPGGGLPASLAGAGGLMV